MPTSAVHHKLLGFRDDSLPSIGEPSAMTKFAVILPAAGKSSRFRDAHYKKPFAPLADRAVWLHTIDRFINRRDVVQTIVVIDAEDRDSFQMKFGANLAILGVDVVDGGTTRADSVRRALEHVRAEIPYVAVHDAVRPCVADEWIDRVFAEAHQSGAAMLAVPVVSTIKRSVNGATIQSTVDRSQLWEAQTPQVFRRELLIQAYASTDASSATDESELIERLGHPVRIVLGSRLNLKITTKEDLRIAQALLKLLPGPKLTGGGNPLDDMWR